MHKKQKSIFLEGEGDSWFSRNKHVSQDKMNLGELEKFIKPGFRILEIGCSDGRNSWIAEKMGATYFGIDPSAKAIALARITHPTSQFDVGTSDSLNFPDNHFDILFFGFCLYLVDRSLLCKTVSEADRVLKSPGFLSILDFDTKYPYKRPYSHMSGVSTYKMDYGQVFLSFPHYVSAFKKVFSHDKKDDYEVSIQERCSVQVLYKNLGQGYFGE